MASRLVGRPRADDNVQCFSLAVTERRLVHAGYEPSPTLDDTRRQYGARPSAKASVRPDGLLIARTTTSAPTTTTNPSSDFASQDPLRTIAKAGGSTDELLRNAARPAQAAYDRQTPL
jgi:hypothetical protein